MNLVRAKTGGNNSASFYLWASMVGSIPDNNPWEKFPIETNRINLYNE
jgi:hypothetical protein